MKQNKKPLYRKVNTRTHGVRHGNGGKARWERNGKQAKNNEVMRSSMHSHHRHGLDYTPLFKFLLSKVGQDWDAVHSEAIGRLDKEEPIFWMVSLQKDDGEAVVRTGENSYFSGLYVDEDNRLAMIDPSLTVEMMKPGCACCTHTFNGQRFTQGYSPPC